METEKFYSVYIHTNKINNKRYIGITSLKNPQNRWRHGNGYKNQLKFYRAIQKYGWDGFNHEIIATNLTDAEAKQLEKELIEKYDSMNPACGYNATRGGDGNCKYKTIAERKEAQKLSGERARLKRNSDPEKREKYLQDQRRHKQLRKLDAEKHLKDLTANNVCHKRTRSNPETKAKDRQAEKILRADVKQIRLELINIYKQKPELFSVENYEIIFARRQTPNGSWMYVYNSKKKLVAILNDIKEILNGKTNT